jgi:hypothetical protein
MSDKSKKNMNNKPTEWSDFSIKNNSLLEDVSTWSPKDFIGYIRSVYYQKYFTSLFLAPAFTYMELSKLKDIMSIHVPHFKTNVNAIMKMYIDWYFDIKIYKEHSKTKNWSLRNFNKAANISSFLTTNNVGESCLKKVKKEKIHKKSVSNLVLKKYLDGDEKLFIKDYGLIVPFAYLISASKMDWPTATSYIKRGVKKCIDSSISFDYIVEVTNQYGPYDKLRKLNMSALLFDLSSEFSFPLSKVRLYSNV